MKTLLVIALLGSAVPASSFASGDIRDLNSDQAAASFERMLTDRGSDFVQPVSYSRDNDQMLQVFNAALLDSPLSVCALSRNAPDIAHTYSRN